MFVASLNRVYYGREVGSRPRVPRGVGRCTNGTPSKTCQRTAEEYVVRILRDVTYRTQAGRRAIAFGDVSRSGQSIAEQLPKKHLNLKRKARVPQAIRHLEGRAQTQLTVKRLDRKLAGRGEGPGDSVRGRRQRHRLNAIKQFR